MTAEPRTTTRSGAGPSDAALVIAARAGEAWAQEALFSRYAAQMLGLAGRILASSDEAEDLVQDAFVRVLTHVNRLKNPQAFHAWLRVLVVRLAQKRLRRRRLLVRLGLRSSEPVDPEMLIAVNAPGEVASELRAVYLALGRLPANERIALVLRRIEGMELTEIAEHMHMSVSTVKRRLASAEGCLKPLGALYPGSDHDDA